jgi:broad specificity phosphatase PhoE
MSAPGRSQAPIPQRSVAQGSPVTAVVYLVRHGRTAGNGQCYVGWLDMPLDDTGRAQAQAAAQRLVGRRVDVVHASPLRRARDTGEAVRDACGGVALQVQAALREVHYGDYTGRDKHEHPLHLRRDHVDRPLPGGESLADVGQRVRAYVDAELHPRLARGEAVAVVAHFWSLRWLLASLRGQDLPALLAARDYRPANGSVYALPVKDDGTRWRCGALECVDPPAGDAGSQDRTRDAEEAGPR